MSERQKIISGSSLAWKSWPKTTISALETHVRLRMNTQEKRYPPKRTLSCESLNHSEQKRSVPNKTMLRRPEMMEDTTVLLLLTEAAAKVQSLVFVGRNFLAFAYTYYFFFQPASFLYV